MALAKYPFDQKYLILTSVRGETEVISPQRHWNKGTIKTCYFRVLQYVKNVAFQGLYIESILWEIILPQK